MSNLVVDINGVEYSEHYNYISVGYEQTILNTTVYVDDSDIINHFDVTSDSNWVEIRRIRNEITFIVNKNSSIAERVATIQFTHNVDSDKFVTITLNQVACEYPISISPEEITFDTLLDNTDETMDEVTIDVTTANGVCDYGIGPIVEYVKNLGDSEYYVVANDGGLKIEKVDNSHLKITNYGKVSLYDDNYYIITLYHRNNPRSKVLLRVNYVDSLDNNDTGLGFDDTEDDISVISDANNEINLDFDNGR